MRIKKLLLSLASLAVVSANTINAQAATLDYSQTASGETGLLEMPTARMLDEGAFGVHFSRSAPYSRIAVISQPFPWLQVLFKYTDIENRLYGPESLSGDQSYKDKSTDIKVRLLKEDYYLPEVSVGIRDVGGTGLFGAEYFALSKQVRNFDLTLGMGWGYLGQQGQIDNPFRLLSSRFDKRTSETGEGGNLSLGDYFSGEKAALFAGLSYQLESLPLTLKLEYDANNYQNEPFDNAISQRSSINVGASYQLTKGISVQGGFVRGDTVLFGLSFMTNLIEDVPKPLDPFPSEVTESPQTVAVEWSQVANRLNDQEGFRVNRIAKSEQTLVVTGHHKSFSQLKGAGRVARVLQNNSSKDYLQFEVVEQQEGLAMDGILIQRGRFKEAANLEVDPKQVVSAISHTQATRPTEQVLYANSDVHRLQYALTPYFSGSFGGPDGFLLYQTGLKFSASYRLSQAVSVEGDIKGRLLDNYDNFTYQSESKLPRVRTSIRDYLKTSRVNMSRLQLNYFDRPADNLFFAAYGGYLETMYGGLGAEALYRPLDSRWAIGADINRVKQRDFDQGFGFRDYGVTTGHVTYYQQLLEQKVLATVSMGQYLAGDRGMTFDLKRTFKNGAALGVWATKTNVSAEQFGEGSFDKGFYISLPLNIFTQFSINSKADIAWRFLTRDGGQKLDKSIDLYEMTQSRRKLDLESDPLQVLR